MSHTLHREGTPESLKEDFVVLVLHSQTLPRDGAGEKIRRFCEIAAKYRPVNIGTPQLGNVYSSPDAREKLGSVALESGQPTACAVFTSAEAVAGLLRELKEEDIGLSVVVSGLMHDVDECCRHAGLNIHSVNFSLGIHGRTEKLEPDEAREVTTMCGHGMLTGDMVYDAVERIRKGRATPRQVSEEFARICTCGIFNPVRGAKLLERMAAAE